MENAPRSPESSQPHGGEVAPLPPHAPEELAPTLETEVVSANPDVGNQEGNFFSEKLRGATDALRLAASGLHLAVTRRRLGATEDDVAILTHSGAVQREIATAVQEGRLPEPGLEPTTKLEQHLWRQESKAADKRVQEALKQTRLRGVYGTTDGHGRPRLLEDEEGNPVKNEYGRVIPLPNDLGTPEHRERIESGLYTNARKREERKAAKKVANSEKVVGKIDHQLNSAVEGRSLTGYSSNDKVEKQSEKAERLRARVQDLEQRRESIRNRRSGRTNLENDTDTESVEIVEAESTNDITETQPALTPSPISAEQAAPFVERVGERFEREVNPLFHEPFIDEVTIGELSSDQRKKILDSNLGHQLVGRFAPPEMLKGLSDKERENLYLTAALRYRDLTNADAIEAETARQVRRRQNSRRGPKHPDAHRYM